MTFNPARRPEYPENICYTVRTNEEIVNGCGEDYKHIIDNYLVSKDEETLKKIAEVERRAMIDKLRFLIDFQNTHNTIKKASEKDGSNISVNIKLPLKENDTLPESVNHLLIEEFKLFWPGVSASLNFFVSESKKKGLYPTISIDRSCNGYNITINRSIVNPVYNKRMASDYSDRRIYH